MSPAALPRRTSFLAALSSVLPYDPPVSATVALRTAGATADARPVADTDTAAGPPPASNVPDPSHPLEDPAPSAKAVDAAYRPRAAVPTWIPARITSPRGASVGVPTAQPTSSTSVGLARLVASRASWGATPQLVADIRASGATAWIDAQLAPSSKVPDTEVDALVAKEWPRLKLQTWEVRDQYHPSSTGDLGVDVIAAYVARAVWSKRQLLEVMVDFWTNHLVVTAPWGEAWDSVHRFHIDVVRKHALGRYADMLVASAKHPAMLNQLDNASSTKRSPNENYGRELLELHTVGVDGGYAESDIRRSALVLTGLSTERESGEYLYRHIRHHRGAVSLLGWSDGNASAYGEPVATSYLVHLARHPRTARRIATKLAVRFVSDTPPSSLVDRLAKVYLDNDTKIAPVVRALLTSSEFAASAGKKTKRPLENIISTARVLGVRPGPDTADWLGGLVWTAKRAGQAPMGWPAPNGYPDVAGAWAGAGAVLTAWNWHMSQCWEVGSDTPRVTYPPLRSLLPATLPATHGQLVDALATRLVGAPLPAAKRDAVCAFVERTAASPLKASDPAASWRLPYLVALVLDTPEFATR
ncbi:DUF1800 family protein [Phycicoccus sp. CSK15P-2]|uniref:DUF1800 domain-containing protein n=1 Tax=Phycicoccus sp. CSK15P-2 TaxID=2807627 RepID=UPI0019514F41|nr:DUF1800 domain-containing protein [Phycicoccus sp. CSK15P-2]MBM6403790.1 DUF1800 family protein [Phycicoccus sp. CSK15P-2]